jgi:raffinose/stachyose/melibiose transport system permease protein
LNQRLPGTVIFRTCLYAPGVLPLVAVGVIWSWLYNPHFGFFNELLRAVGLDSLTQAWLGDPGTAVYWLLIASTWERVGFSMIFYLAGLQSIPQQLLEAAEIDGASGFKRFWYITLPLLREVHVIVLALQVIASFKTFDIIYTLTGGGPGRSTQVLATWMYFNAFQYHHKGLGAALAWVISAIAMGVTFPYIRIMSRR